MNFIVLVTCPVKFEVRYKGSYEAFALCGACEECSIFVLSPQRMDLRSFENESLSEMSVVLNHFFHNVGHVSIKDQVKHTPPEFLPEDIDKAFREAATCISVDCWNAAGAMFRLCIDLATKSKLPPESENAAGLKATVRRNLGLRLPWLFSNGLLPNELKDLSDCIKDDGNDGAHDGSLSEHDALDLYDFTHELLKRLYTEPAKVEAAKQRRIERRKGSASSDEAKG